MIYKTNQTYEVLSTTSCGKLCEDSRSDFVKDWSETLFILKEGDYPLRVSTHWHWLSKQQPSRLVTLLCATHTESFYDRTTATATVLG